ncbi:MAG TPA: hypothetical protein VNH11_31830 [Pirellulales bacterium]|nr:hypothetical protein [Pirellulales bacterium]
MRNQLNYRSGLGLPAACIVLALCVGAAGGLASFVAHGRHGAVSAVAVGVAALTCWLSATAALLLAGRLAATRWCIQGIMAAGFVRFSLPLMVVAASALVQGPLSRAGLFGYMVVFFLLTMGVETLLLVGVIRASSVQSRAAWRGL